MTAELKRQAKQVYRENWKLILILSAIFVVVTSLIDIYGNYHRFGIPYPFSSLIYLFKEILSSIFFIGFLHCLIEIKRKKKIEYRNLLTSLIKPKTLGKIAVVYILSNLLVICTTATNKFFIVYKKLIPYEIRTLLGFVVFIITGYIVLKMFLGNYLLAENLSTSLKQIVTGSFLYMRKNIWKLIKLLLSFFLYYLVINYLNAIAFNSPAYTNQLHSTIFNTVTIKYIFTGLANLFEIFFYPYFYLTLIYFAESICTNLKGGILMTKKDSEFMDYDEDDVLSKLYDKALHIAQPEPATFDEEVYDEELYDELYEEYGEEFFEEDYLENRIKFEESPFEQAEREKFESGTVLSQKEFTYQFQIKSLDSVTISNLLRKTDFYRFLIRNDKIERMLEKVYQKSVNEYLSYGNEQAIGTVAEDNVINGTYFRVVISTSHLVDSYQVEINFYINE